MAMFMIQLGEMLPGGVGSGLYGMMVMAIIAVFVAGLMVGRTPEYLGKKIEAREVKFAMLAAADPAAVDPRLRGGRRGGADGAEGAGAPPVAARPLRAALRLHLGDREQRLGLRRPLGQHPLLERHPGHRHAARPLRLRPAGAGHGRIDRHAKPKLEPTAGTLPTDGPLFVGLLIGVIIIMGGLMYFPAQSLGPIVEHFQVLDAVAKQH
jgi:K+-transporting ATPase ATPase A chain